MLPDAASIELVSGFATYLEALAQEESDPAKKQVILQKAEEYRKAAAPELSNPLIDGPWARIPQWLQQDAVQSFWPASRVCESSYWREPSEESEEDAPVLKALESKLPEIPNPLTEPLRVRFARPVFYSGAHLEHLRTSVTLVHLDRGDPPLWEALFYVKPGDKELKSFDFKSDHIHVLNREVPLNIVGHELEYIRFFMYVVRAEQGAFRLLEGTTLDAAKQVAPGREVWDQVRPPRLKRVKGDGRLIFQVNILYGNAVFSAELAVGPDGQVAMLDDKPLSEVGELDA